MAGLTLQIYNRLFVVLFILSIFLRRLVACSQRFGSFSVNGPPLDPNKAEPGWGLFN